MKRRILAKDRGFIHKYPYTVVGVGTFVFLSIFFSRPLYDIFFTRPTDFEQVCREHKSRLKKRE